MSTQTASDEDMPQQSFFQSFEIDASGAFLASHSAPEEHPEKPTVSERKDQCDQCSYSTSKPGDLKKHLRTHSGERPYSCSICGATFTQVSNLRVHEQKLHMVKPQYHCPTCGKNFRDAETFIFHACGHQTGQPPMQSERKYTCGQCSFSTKYAANLRNHLISHTGEKPHKCPHCIQAYTRKANLMRHLRHHTEEGLFSCSICGASFNQLGNMQRHERMHTVGRPGQERIDTPTESERKHKCELCSYSTDKTTNLKSHILTHTGERPFKCTECPRVFSRKQTLQFHLRTHTQEPLFSCSKCQATFPHSEDLREHERIHTEKLYICPACVEGFPGIDTFRAHKCEGYKTTDLFDI